MHGIRFNMGGRTDGRVGGWRVGGRTGAWMEGGEDECMHGWMERLDGLEWMEGWVGE